MVTKKSRNMELDILRTARDFDEIDFLSPAEKPGRKHLLKLYSNTGDNNCARLRDNLSNLIETGYLLPSYNNKVKVSFCTRGLTPKGERRLYKLEHPVRSWMKANWFPFLVAIVTSAVSIAGAVASYTS